MDGDSTGQDGSGRGDRPGFWTLPNALCVFRFAGSFALLPVAAAGSPYWFAAIYLVLITTDLADGPIARRLHQRSNIGAHLDSVADLALNTCLLVGVLVLRWDVLRGELLLIGAIVASYALSLGLGYWKFGRLPAYHTYIAKLTQWFAMIAAVSLILEWSVWPFRVVAVSAVVGNLEAVAITCVLTKRQTDVSTVFRLWQTD